MTQCSEQEIARLFPLVSTQRREQALQYHHTFGQYCCLKSYTLLCELLEEWGRVHQLSVNKRPIFLYNEYGAPYLDGGPYFSISHCKSGIAVAVSEQPVGVDIEVIRPFRDELMRKTMNPIEQQTILNSNQADWAFIRLWTQKEALLKLQGTGIITDLHHTLDNTEHIKCLQTTHLQPDYICTIAMQ